jgi:hypothetical protein
LSPKTGFGMNGHGLAVGLCGLVDAVLVDLHAVGGIDERLELDPRVVLREADFVWCFSTGTPICAMYISMSERRSCAESIGGTGK